MKPITACMYTKECNTHGNICLMSREKEETKNSTHCFCPWSVLHVKTKNKKLI